MRLKKQHLMTPEKSLLLVYLLGMWRRSILPRAWQPTAAAGPSPAQYDALVASLTSAPASCSGHRQAAEAPLPRCRRVRATCQDEPAATAPLQGSQGALTGLFTTASLATPARPPPSPSSSSRVAVSLLDHRILKPRVMHRETRDTEAASRCLVLD